VCPSRDLTTTPRQRIVLRRELQRAKAAGDAALVAEIEDDYGYAGIDTCAVDGMCQTACPVLINTGDLVKRLRQEKSGKGTGGRSRPGTGRAPPGRRRWPSTSPPCCRRRWSPGRRRWAAR
jgi:D-lactate dehydrogenase